MEEKKEMEDKWICSSCTLLNDPAVQFCVACETKKGQNDSSTSSGEDSSKDFAEHYFQYWNDNLDADDEGD
ncbi:hypothetical protein DAPPUDRAFT_323919 [Daphnia pulex]|uniref:RanBP2-type domain-containing protein n=1 Tax=Daphnia pulex TaxID=6669 RepID=E9H073_DAPPU|nr:hypothetical protein DAPPUDRAFT_343614 [Daphnia pulex]EFX74749.1 hypothetical protein DAPPUDRAFT_323919 [Daphnia pulex]|eukprot:EFX60465.1 hypothetical protein DAPPUDRAFT_343614 [Daphnia pulex]